MFYSNYQTDVLEEVTTKEALAEEKQLVLYNDDVNTFDHVIETLITVCEHNALQAEQCAMIVHYNGKCTVKTAALKKIKPMCSALLDAGLSAEIQ